jgi:hypothetical protein
LGVFEQEVDKCRRRRRYSAKKLKDEGESLLLSFKSMYASGEYSGLI